MSNWASALATADLANEFVSTPTVQRKTMTDEARLLLRRIASGDSTRRDTPELRELLHASLIEECPAVKGHYQVTEKGSKAVYP